MDIKKPNSVNRILYSSYRSHNSTMKRIEPTESTFSRQLAESNNYLMIIDEFYHSLRQKRKLKKQSMLLHKHPVDTIIDLIVSFVKSYNKHYMTLLNHDNQFNTTKHNKLIDVIIKFKFSLNQIGINISSRNLLKINTSRLETLLESSFTHIDFLFEKNGLLDHLQNLYVDKIKESNITHFDKKV